MGFSRQEYWSGFPFPSSGDLLDPGIEPRFPAWQADSLLSEPPRKLFKMIKEHKRLKNDQNAIYLSYGDGEACSEHVTFEKRYEGSEDSIK